MHRMVRQSARRLMNTNFFGIAGSVIASRKKNPVISSCAAISTSLRKTPMFTIQTSGMGPSWLRRANALRLENYAKSGCAIRFESITRKANFTAGGIIRCAHLKKIAAFASTRFWPAIHRRKDAAQPESILKCAKARNRPITRRYGRSLHLRKGRTPNSEHRTPNSDSELDVERWALDVRRL